ncbi:MAG: 7-carboxy-7-deazaguanine synthase QueE [Candidatus Hydrothermia bacterium]
MKLVVSEIFKSIQGEGPKAGAPSVFLRLGGCNLRCDFCDTKYASFHDYSEEWQAFDIDEVIKKVIEIRLNAWNFVITGGEPLLQKKQLALLIGKVASLFRSIEIETNGTIVPEGLPGIPSLTFNVSVKLANSGIDKEIRLKRDALVFFSECENAFFKFVVSDENDIEEILSIVNEYYIPRYRVYLMPMAANEIELRERATKLSELALGEGFNYSDRLHIRLFGSARGK